MSSLVICVKSARTGTDLADRVGESSTRPHNACRKLVAFLEGAIGGLESCRVDVQTGSSDPVAASGTVTLSYADIANNDTVTVAGTDLTCVTGTPAGAQFKKQTDATVTAANLAALINSNATTSKYVYATSALGVVTVTALVKHSLGNLVTLATSNATGFVLSGVALTGGAGGAMAALPTTYAFGL